MATVGVAVVSGRSVFPLRASLEEVVPTATMAVKELVALFVSSLLPYFDLLTDRN